MLMTETRIDVLKVTTLKRFLKTGFFFLPSTLTHHHTVVCSGVLKYEVA